MTPVASSPLDTVVINSRAGGPGGARLGIVDGVFVGTGDDEAWRTIDARDGWVMPGATCLHARPEDAQKLCRLGVTTAWFDRGPLAMTAGTAHLPPDAAPAGVWRVDPATERIEVDDPTAVIDHRGCDGWHRSASSGRHILLLDLRAAHGDAAASAAESGRRVILWVTTPDELEAVVPLKHQVPAIHVRVPVDLVATEEPAVWAALTDGLIDSVDTAADSSVGALTALLRRGSAELAPGRVVDLVAGSLRRLTDVRAVFGDLEPGSRASFVVLDSATPGVSDVPTGDGELKLTVVQGRPVHFHGRDIDRVVPDDLLPVGHSTDEECAGSCVC
ncbi:hypothetical protein JL108_03110 [Aeromicrobium sp. YIM 150415]|uniref:hypothetical protein n=1 Tax=Aeromicrobium sp. YIM 150415 TaxID=2803912 RepID=UPI0019640E73|nr:hypothetical protein [Aeromicrobium sp. YIM 150415]MBM9462423.1 hypothetical protein [Aeromicrobium sp. YIM 150415]